MVHTNMVDMYIEIIKGKSAAALRGLSMTEDVFACHFPNFPILPGVLMLQAIQEVSEKLVNESIDTKTRRAILVEFEGVKFRKYARPGDQLFIDVQIVEECYDNYILKGKIKTQRDRIAEVKKILINVKEVN